MSESEKEGTVFTTRERKTLEVIPMLKRNALTTIVLALAVSLNSGLCAQAAEFSWTTTLHLATPLHPEAIDAVVLNWSTDKTSGHVSSGDLIDYSMELWSGAELIYTDIILVDGLVQPTDISLRNPPFWDFDLDTLKLSQLNNGTEVLPLSPTGTWYQIGDGLSFCDDGELLIWRYKDGDWTLEVSLLADWSVSDCLAGQETTANLTQTVTDLAGKIVQLNVQKGIANSLDAKLNAVFDALDDINTNNDVAAVNSLNAFINAVYTQLGNGKIPPEDAALAQELIDCAQAIIDWLAPPEA